MIPFRPRFASCAVINLCFFVAFRAKGNSIPYYISTTIKMTSINDVMGVEMIISESTLPALVVVPQKY